MEMPTINIEAIQGLTEQELSLVREIVATQGKNKGKLRAAKPKCGGNAAYVWRMVAFSVSPMYQHHCMPICADFDIEIPSVPSGADTSVIMESARVRRAIAKDLDRVADAVINSIPKDQWHGTRRWARVFHG